MSKPLSPKEALERKIHVIPPAVIDAVNDLLTEKFSGGYCTLMQSDVVERILQRMPGYTERDLINHNWLDFEPVFRDNGWKVEYNRPAYCETDGPNWKFTALEKQ